MAKRADTGPPVVVGVDPDRPYRLPTLDIPRKASAYTLGRVLPLVAAGAVTVWSFGGTVRAVQMPGGGIWKGADGLDAEHRRDPQAVLDFWRECREVAGCRQAGGYAAPFHALFETERAPASLDFLLSPYFSGGWEAALVKGRTTAPAYQYDMRSAYLWASTLGLPVGKSWKASRVIRGNKPGIYLVEHDPRESLPYPFNRHRHVIATDAECEAYNLDVRRVLGGATWSDSLPADAVTSVCDRFTFGKQMGRAYWGRWASSAPLLVTQGGKTREMPNRSRNVAWAHLIVSRVRSRLWEASRAAGGLHVYVDAVIGTREIPTGPGLGDFRLVREYLGGVDVRGTGRYAPIVVGNAGGKA